MFFVLFLFCSLNRQLKNIYIYIDNFVFGPLITALLIHPVIIINTLLQIGKLQCRLPCLKYCV